MLPSSASVKLQVHPGNHSFQGFFFSAAAFFKFRLVKEGFNIAGMGDNGKLYPAFDSHYAEKNATLCAAADICVPNITEASYLTGVPYLAEYSESYVKDLLKKLANLGCKVPVLTGVSLSKGKTGAMGYDSEKQDFFVYQNDLIPTFYHGTGDVFSSVCAGCMVLGLDRVRALQVAADFTRMTVEVTLSSPDKPWYGVDFEACIPELIRMIS